MNADDLEKILSRILIPRCSTLLRKNIDGTFTCTISQSNGNRRTKNSTVSVRGYSLAGVLETAAKQLEDQISSLQTIL